MNTRYRRWRMRQILVRTVVLFVASTGWLAWSLEGLSQTLGRGYAAQSVVAAALWTMDVMFTAPVLLAQTRYWIDQIPRSTDMPVVRRTPTSEIPDALMYPDPERVAVDEAVIEQEMRRPVYTSPGFVPMSQRPEPDPDPVTLVDLDPVPAPRRTVYWTPPMSKTARQDEYAA